MDVRRSLLAAAKVSRLFIDSGANNTFICQGPSRDCRSLLLELTSPPEDDPLVTGAEDLLSNAAKSWHDQFQREGVEQDLKR